ncbi:TlpA family protein disulfide reductase [bacterium]|nr:TlpA family protein disulfide reductase [bacterium]
MKKQLWIALVLVAGLTAVGCSKQADTQTEAKAETTEQVQTQETSMGNEDAKAIKAAGLIPQAEAPMAPQWTLPATDGTSHSLADFSGKVIILDFWDTWCPPCKKEIPGFIELQNQYGDDGLVVIGAAFGRDGQAAVAQFVKDWEMNYPVVIADGKTNQMYGGIRSIPTTFIIDRTGRARAKHVGYVDKAVFEQQVKALL